MRIGSALRWAPAALALALAYVAAFAQVAWAGDDALPVTLEWNAPPECPALHALDVEIARLLAGSAIAPERRMRARADVSQEGERWRVKLTTSSTEGAGDRTLDAGSCSALADATALILALAIDPARVAVNQQATRPAATPAPAPAPAPPPPPTPPPTPTPTPAPAPAPAPALLSLSASTSMDWATLPHPAPGLGASLSVAPGFARSVAFELSASYFPTQGTGVGTPRGGDFDLRAFGASVCANPVRDAWEVGPCAGFELAWISASGAGQTAPTSGDAIFGRVRGGGSLAAHLLPWLLLRSDVSLGFSLARPEFTAAGVFGGAIHRPSFVSGRATIGVELRF